MKYFEPKWTRTLKIEIIIDAILNQRISNEIGIENANCNWMLYWLFGTLNQIDWTMNNHFEVFNELITIYFLITLSGITGDFSVNKPFEVIVTWVALSILLLYLVVHMIY